MRILFIAFLSALFLPCAAQMLSILPTMDDPEALVFNTDFVQRNGVLSIVGVKSVKRDNQPMQEKSDRSLYRFDEMGRMIYSNNSFGRPGSGTDTANIKYTYDANGHVTQRLRNDLNGHYAYDLELDTAGRTVHETYTRIENLGTDRYVLVPGARTIISDEHFRYDVVNDTAWRMTYVNEIGLPYRERTWSKDQWGYLRAIEDRYIVSGRRSRMMFRYDEKGRLAERVEQADLADPHIVKYSWRYDSAGNVVESHTYRDERETRHTEYLYEEAAMLLKASVSKDMDTGLIHVVRYTTTRR